MIFPGRYAAQIDGPFAVFLIGMRINLIGMRINRVFDFRQVARSRTARMLVMQMGLCPVHRSFICQVPPDSLQVVIRRSFTG